MSKNKITTPGYFIKRLRDNGFYVNRIFDNYSAKDPRRWTVLINPGRESVYITCHDDEKFKDQLFELSDGGVNFPKNINLKTESIEIVVRYLIENNVANSCDITPQNE